MSDKMKCETEAKISLLHAYPLISIQSEGKSYDYIYDLLNDPMTPDLVPISKASEDSVSVPNLSIARKDS